MKIVIIGTGYVGLVSGTCLADLGHEVTCVDNNAEKIATLMAGKVPFYEPGLEELVAKIQSSGNLHFTTSLAQVVPQADMVMIAVGTPSRAADGLADLSYVHQACREVAGALDGYTTIVTKSTVPMGTGDEIERIIATNAPQATFSVVSNPEFLREGAAIKDFMAPDRIVIGANDDQGIQAMDTLYEKFIASDTPIFRMSRRASELTKYAANAFLSVKLSFINEIADLCERAGVDVRDVADGIGSDNRIGRSFLNAGPGYGGSCFPKDTLALVRTSHDFDSPMRTVETIVALNDQRKRAMARKVVAACGGSIRGKKICVLGLTFKPETDDVREAPSITIIKGLQDFGALVSAYDPQGAHIDRDAFPGIEHASNPYEAAQDAHAVVIITDWKEFAELDLAELKSRVAEPVLVDLRNIIVAEIALNQGFSYTGVGRG